MGFIEGGEAYKEGRGAEQRKTQTRRKGYLGLIHIRELWRERIPHCMAAPPWGSSVYPSISQPLTMGHDGVKVTKAAPFNQSSSLQSGASGSP